jgi:hypothetical protein
MSDATRSIADDQMVPVSLSTLGPDIGPREARQTELAAATPPHPTKDLISAPV